MNIERETMNQKLKEEVVPVLRNNEFKGTFPHFYRETGLHVDLLTFQFRSGGGSFVVEISYADPSLKNVYIEQETPPNKLRVSQTTDRLRLGSDGEKKDHWFDFESGNIITRKSRPGRLARTVIKLIQEQAIPWWDKKRELCQSGNGPPMPW